MTGAQVPGGVAIAPVGTSPVATGAWSHVGYARDVQVDVAPEYEPGAWPMGPLPMSVEVAVPLSLFRKLKPCREPCRRTAEAIEAAR